ncbi:ppGpp synthetase/RelA/SpoT-type nucleotidyltransferase [Flavobacterium sp. HSC-32F16]|uniref:hypothetical protein n=1 Tax=Flavobacterium sp. HSC-32F16 TaxID=2910964 RepID=UPI0020A3B165|nr:hypothetical protein [Flavobacterium sp. HSC-32F16]MCP2025751.1 ppGpp synthetase/RelA/SpoT-type nucleotidyltransferase [Flavobacterium sp. HSC-32F16]
MRAIADKLIRIEKIVTKFEDFREEFIACEARLKKILSDIIQDYSEEFNLSKHDSVKKLKFYTVVSRVKEPNSLSEKLIRNNDYNVFDPILENVENFNQVELKSKLKEVEDIIGVKILTDLNIDTINMYKLITSSNFITNARGKGIELNEDDLKKQPVRMQNGLNIYKIRCQFEDWKFELQIKSKLESAWGDMEHSIFYKDYKVTPVRDLAQQSMNHIGKLLIEIDGFLQEIRSANDNFSINSRVILFINQFEENYSRTIREKLNGIPYNFKKIASICYNISQVNSNILDNVDINTDYQSIELEKFSFYIKYRNENFDLQIFESIILSNLDTPIDQKNLENNLDNYFTLIKQSYIKMITENRLIQDEELALFIVETIFKACLSYDCKEYILNTKDLYTHIDNLKILIDAIEVLELDQDIIEQIISVYSIHTFNGNIYDYCQTIDKDQLTQKLEQTKNEIEKLSIDSKSSITSNLSKLISSLN